MKLATRLNSFLPQFNNNLAAVFSELEKIDINYVDLNFPEHTKLFKAEEMKALLKSHNLKANGVALRFRNEFINGELGNVNAVISNKALQLCKDAIDYCKGIDGEVVTIWLGFDGFDYPFQINYSKVWEQIKNSIVALADYDPTVKISIEYKPFEERSYAFLDSVGLTSLMVNDVNRSNLGITLDYCHMLMKHENPAYSASVVGSRGKLFGVHLNDGYGVFDDGLMVGSVTLFQTIEFLYYVRLACDDFVIYFDTFPKRENAIEECKQNIEMTNKLCNMIDSIGMDEFKRVIAKNNAVEANKLILKFLR